MSEVSGQLPVSSEKRIMLDKAIELGLSWDLVDEGGKEADLDCSCILLDAFGQIIEGVYFNNLESLDGGVKHSGDNRDGEGDGDDESITINLPLLPEKIHALILLVTSFAGSFERLGVETASVAVRMLSTSRELARYNLPCEGGYSALIMCSIVRKREGNCISCTEWELQPVGKPTKGADYLEALPSLAPMIQSLVVQEGDTDDEGYNKIDRILYGMYCEWKKNLNRLAKDPFPAEDKYASNASLKKNLNVRPEPDEAPTTLEGWITKTAQTLSISEERIKNIVNKGLRSASFYGGEEEVRKGKCMYENGDEYEGEYSAKGERHGRGVYLYKSSPVTPLDQLVLDEFLESQLRRDTAKKGVVEMERRRRPSIIHFQKKNKPREVREWATQFSKEKDEYEIERRTFDFWFSKAFSKGAQVEKLIASLAAKHSLHKGYVRMIMEFGGHSCFRGTFVHNKKQGAGVLRYSDGSLYDGLFASNKRHGNGVFYYANGDIYRGQWKNNKKHGQGAYTFFSKKKGAPKQKYIGTWENNSMVHGKWELEETRGTEPPPKLQRKLQLQLLAEQKPLLLPKIDPFASLLPVVPPLLPKKGKNPSKTSFALPIPSTPRTLSEPFFYYEGGFSENLPEDSHGRFVSPRLKIQQRGAMTSRPSEKEARNFISKRGGWTPRYDYLSLKREVGLPVAALLPPVPPPPPTGSTPKRNPSPSTSFFVTEDVELF